MRAGATPALVLAAALGGCATMQPYAEHGDATLLVRSTVQSSFWHSAQAVLHLFRASGRACATDYLGAVELPAGERRIALASGGPLYLKFTFTRAGRFLGNQSSATLSYPLLLVPRAGGQYTADATFAGSQYGVLLRSAGQGAPLGEDLGGCRGIRTEP